MLIFIINNISGEHERPIAKNGMSALHRATRGPSRADGAIFVHQATTNDDDEQRQQSSFEQQRQQSDVVVASSVLTVRSI